MTKRPGYKEAKNHLHNTLGITREDARNMLKEIVREQIYQLTKNGDIETLVRRVMNENIRDIYEHGSSWTRQGWKNRVEKELEAQAVLVVREQLAKKVSIDVDFHEVKD